MKYGIYADIHGNLEAAEVVLDYFKGRVDSLVFVGDVVGYGANPNECIDLVKDSSIIIAGNHDWATIGLMNINYFNPYAKRAILWTKKKVTPSKKRLLENLDLTFNNEDFTMVHGSLDAPEKFKYIFDSYEAKETIKRCNTPLCFVAHSHVPVYFWKRKSSHETPKREVVSENSEEVILDSNKEYVFNVGSVGQPRDGNPYSCCVIYDSSKGKLHYERLKYPIEVTQKKIVKAGLPQILSNRLEKGY